MKYQNSICPECGYDQAFGENCQRCGEKLVSFTDDNSVGGKDQLLGTDSVFKIDEEQVYEG